MDLKVRAAPPTGDERAAIESVLGVDERSVEAHTIVGGHRNRERRWQLLPTLHAVNDRVGWISQPAIDEIARRLDISPAEVYGVASFYALFSLTERSPRQVHTCIDLACRAVAPHAVANLPDGAHSSPCLGMCEQAPATLTLPATVDPPITPAAYCDAPGDRSLLRRVGRGDPLDLDAFLADDGFAALARARTLEPLQIIDAVDAAGLIGRGGAGFPTAVKWRAVLDQPAEQHYVVCNADESEPGTFKDRVLIENDPYALIESIAIAMLATGSSQAFIYLRGEYPRAWRILQTALERVADHELLDGLTITPFRGAGAYICGEETAIFNSIEGYRGEPRNKPPFPFQRGLFGKPTAVNNVETLMNVPAIVRAITDDGTPGDITANRRLFCLSGIVVNPGVYEVELGLTLGELIEQAGGLPPGSGLQAVLLGGAAGGFASPADLDLVLDHASIREVGFTLGSGVVMVLDHTVDLTDFLTRIADFFRDESCGQCVPCRVGTVRQHEAITRLATGVGNGEIELLRDIGRAMTDASICGLGQTAFSAIETAIDRLGAFDA